MLAVIWPSFPAHPRTRKRIADFGLHAGQLRVLDPLSDIEFLGMQSRATIIITTPRDTGRNDIPGRPLLDSPREYRAPRYGFCRNQRSCRT